MLFRLVLALLSLALVSTAKAETYLVADIATGDVLMQSDATAPWFPASTTKLMTTYVALSAVRDGRLTLDTPLTMSHRAAAAPASKMGFSPGTLVTLGNALKMLMVKSPNDVAIMIAEGLSGTVEDFAGEMNKAAAKLGMTQSHFVNPNGLHDADHYSSARDMALLARALLKEFPERADLFSIGMLRLGRTYMHNHNGLLGRVAGVDGMKTGFTCPAGWNIVATAQRNGRKLVVVVFGGPGPRIRNQQAEMLFDRGFALTGSGQTLETLPPSASANPPDMRDEICHRRGGAAAAAMQQQFVASVQSTGVPMIAGALTPPPTGEEESTSAFEPVDVYVGSKPGWTGPVLAARDDVEPPSPVTAYAGDRPQPDPEAKNALKRAVKPVAHLRSLRLTPQARARQTAAARRVAQKSHN